MALFTHKRGLLGHLFYFETFVILEFHFILFSRLEIAPLDTKIEI